MKATIQVRVSVVGDENSFVLEVDKNKTLISEEAGKDDVYCELFNLIGQLQYDIVNDSGHAIDFFL